MAQRCCSFIDSGGKVSGGTAGAVEGNHRFCLSKSREPLRAPFTLIVWDTVADFVAGQHGVV
ncbi:MAG: hypothetical protein EBU90_28045 [Proteobacteria bacterium]|nr:hypothetical protein [Pseudomonadota bacterium]